MIVSKYIPIDGKSYVEASDYDNVLYSLKRANDKIYKLEKELSNIKNKSDTEPVFVKCPVCGGKTRTKIRPDTEAKNLIVFCPKCKRESAVDIKGMEVENGKSNMPN